jgi:8-oxo-dGTP pyrophosphatase MutT (NUDIX family)
MTVAPLRDLDSMTRSAGSRAVRPRRAATLILVKSQADGARLLMGRRSGGHDFMPNKWVFPGGRVDRGDFGAPAASELTPEVAGKLRAAASGDRSAGLPRALAMAAVRETFEEAGLLLARRSAPGRRPGSWRRFLEAGGAPDLAALDFFARAVTPPDRPKRFDACFFTADAQRLLSLDGGVVSGELDEIDWFSFEEIEALDLPAVTRLVVRELKARMADPARPVLTLTARSLRPRPPL